MQTEEEKKLDTLSFVPFVEIMRQPREAAKREFPSLGHKGEAEGPAATRNGKGEKIEKSLGVNNLTRHALYSACAAV